MVGLKNDEILTCLLLIVIGYFIAKMFKGCERFNVGADEFGQSCDSTDLNANSICKENVGSGTSCRKTCMEWDSSIPIWRDCLEWGYYCN